MQRIEKWKQKAWFSLLLNVILLALLLLIFKPGYETNDDIGIQNIVSGVKGRSDAHLVYVNYLLGWLLAFAYKICPVHISVYAIAQYLTMLFAFTAIAYVLLNKIKNKSAFWITLALLVPFSYEGYIKLQYTKTAGIASAAGLFLLCFAVTSGIKAKKMIVCALLLCAVGFMYRDMQFWVEAMLLSAIAIPILFDQFSKVQKGFWIKCTVSGMLLFFVLAVLHFINEASYRSEEWQAYREFNELRTELYDYGFPDYGKNQETYEKLGIDMNAYQLYRGWNFEDTDKFTVEVMRQLVALKEKKVINGAFFRDFFELFPAEFFTIASFNICLLLFVISLLWGDHSRGTWFKLLYEILMILLLYFYLYYQGRYLYNRVDVGIWLAASLVVLWALPGSGQVLIIVPGSCCWRRSCVFHRVPGISAGDGIRRIRPKRWHRARAEIEQIHSDPEHLYLNKVGLVSFYDAYGVFDWIPVGMSSNIYALGGWTTNLPVYFEQLEVYGIKNPYKDMIGNEKIYLVDNKIEKTMEYIHTYYDADAKEELVSTIGKLKVYQIHAGS